jgi:hypothetical protein
MNDKFENIQRKRLLKLDCCTQRYSYNLNNIISWTSTKWTSPYISQTYRKNFLNIRKLTHLLKLLFSYCHLSKKPLSLFLIADIRYACWQIILLNSCFYFVYIWRHISMNSFMSILFLLPNIVFRTSQPFRWSSGSFILITA